MTNPMSSRRLPVRVLPITLLAVLLMLTLRLGSVWQGFTSLSGGLQVVANQAQAQDPPAPGAAPAKPGEEAGASAPITAELPRDPTRFNEAEIKLLQKLSERRDALDRTQRELAQREALLQAADKRLDDKIAELNAIKAELQGLLTRRNDQEDGRLKSLVRIYEAMKPKDAAQIFDKLDMNVLLGVVERMKENKVAPILASMQPDRAKAVTDMLADRREITFARP